MMMEIIKNAAKRIRLPDGYAREDLYGYGWLGYKKALKTYKSNSEASMSFDSYAEWQAKYAMIDGWRKENPLSRGNIKLQKAKDRLLLSGRTITDDALCEELGVGKKRLETMKIRFIELDETEPFYDLGFEKMDARILLSCGLAGLNTKELSVIWMHFYRGDTLADIGKNMRISESRVSQIKALALRKMKRTMTYDEV